MDATKNKNGQYSELTVTKLDKIIFLDPAPVRDFIQLYCLKWPKHRW